MTLQFLLTSICFTAYPFAGMVIGFEEAGGVDNRAPVPSESAGKAIGVMYLGRLVKRYGGTAG